MQNELSAPSDAEDPANRRRYRRKPVIWSAKIDTPYGTLDCVTLEVSVGGCKLRLLQPVEDAVNDVSLLLEKFGSFHARIAWRRAPEIGLQFESAPAEIADRFGGILPFDAPVDESVLDFELAQPE